MRKVCPAKQGVIDPGGLEESKSLGSWHSVNPAFQNPKRLAKRKKTGLLKGCTGGRRGTPPLQPLKPGCSTDDFFGTRAAFKGGKRPKSQDNGIWAFRYREGLHDRGMSAQSCSIQDGAVCFRRMLKEADCCEPCLSCRAVFRRQLLFWEYPLKGICRAVCTAVNFVERLSVIFSFGSPRIRPPQE